MTRINAEITHCSSSSRALTMPKVLAPVATPTEVSFFACSPILLDKYIRRAAQASAHLIRPLFLYLTHNESQNGQTAISFSFCSTATKYIVQFSWLLPLFIITRFFYIFQTKKQQLQRRLYKLKQGATDLSRPKTRFVSFVPYRWDQREEGGGNGRGF